MAQPTVKTAVVFKPKRNWKPKKRDRNITRRKKRKKWWRRNKHKIKLKRRKRQRMLKHNSLFKQWRKKRQKEKTKRRMRFGSKNTDLPQSWFIFHDDVDEGNEIDIDMGYVIDYDPDNEELLIYDVDENNEKTVGLEDFLTHSEFLEDSDLDNFELIMDQYYGGPEDDLDIVPDDDEAPRMEFEVDMDEFSQKVARTWLLQSVRKE